MRIHALIIDPQQDFCDPATGTLVVPGAHDDMARLAEMLDRNGSQIDALHITLDSHHYRHIAHPVWWIDGAGRHPDPFTIITALDIETERWVAADPLGRERSLSYVRQLDANGRYPLCIWPYHCLIGSTGHAVVPELSGALYRWEERTRRPVDFIWKGANVWTENYSAIQADVPDPDDPATQRNETLIAALNTADLVLLAGEAGSHCVANTVRDLAEASVGSLDRFVLLTDAMSAVPGFESYQAQFLDDMVSRGMRTATTSVTISPDGDLI